MIPLPQKLTDKIVKCLGFDLANKLASPDNKVKAVYFKPQKRTVPFCVSKEELVYEDDDGYQEYQEYHENVNYRLQFPYLIFVYSNVIECFWVYCSKEEPTENTQEIFILKFPNIGSSSGLVCLGLNDDDDFPISIERAIELFWNTPFTTGMEHVYERWQNDPKFIDNFRNVTGKPISALKFRE